MSKTPTRIQTSMRFKPETLKILDYHAKLRAIPRTYLMETIIREWNHDFSLADFQKEKWQKNPKNRDQRTESVSVDPRKTTINPTTRAKLDFLGDRLAKLEKRVATRTIDTAEMDGVEDMLVKCVKDVEDNRRSMETIEKLIGILLKQRFRDHMYNNPTDGKLTITDKMVEDLMALADE